MPKRTDRIIIDTNLWISFLINRSYFKLDILLSEGDNITLLFSEELLNEFITVVQRPKFKKYFSLQDVEDLLLKINEHAVFIEVKSTVSVCRDPKDNFLLALAKDGEATHLVTGDPDLLVIQTFSKTKILTMTQYLA